MKRKEREVARQKAEKAAHRKEEAAKKELLQGEKKQQQRKGKLQHRERHLIVKDHKGDHLFEVLLREAKLLQMINQVMKIVHIILCVIMVRKIKYFALQLALVPQN